MDQNKFHILKENLDRIKSGDMSVLPETTKLYHELVESSWDKEDRFHDDRVEGYPGSLQQLARAVGRMRYDAVATFLHDLEQEFIRQEDGDKRRGRPQLASVLNGLVACVAAAKNMAKVAHGLCKPHLKEELGTNQVDIEAVLNQVAKRRIVNSHDIMTVEFIKKGAVIEVSQEERDEFRFSGLAITDFIQNKWGGTYE